MMLLLICSYLANKSSNHINDCLDLFAGRHYRHFFMLLWVCKLGLAVGSETVLLQLVVAIASIALHLALESCRSLSFHLAIVASCQYIYNQFLDCVGHDRIYQDAKSNPVLVAIV